MILEYIECHADRHDWEETSFMKAPSMGIAYDRHCVLCHTIKRELWSQGGVLISRSYYYPKDYKAPTGMTKVNYRKVWFDEKLKANRKLKAV